MIMVLQAFCENAMEFVWIKKLICFDVLILLRTVCENAMEFVRIKILICFYILISLQAFCENAMEFQSRDPRNVIAVHCKGGKGRTGVMVLVIVLALFLVQLQAANNAHHGFVREARAVPATWYCY